MTVISK